MRITILVLLAFTIQGNLFSQEQQRISFDTIRSKVLTPMGENIKSVNHSIKVEVLDDIKQDIGYKIKILASTSVPKEDYKLLTPYIYIPKNTKTKSNAQIVLEIKPRTKKKGTQLIELSLEPIPNSQKVVKIAPITRHLIFVEDGKITSEYDKEQSFKAADFRIDLGTNFDFLDGVDVGGLYANVFTFAPNLIVNDSVGFNIFKRKNKAASQRYKKIALGLLSGIRQNRLIGDTINDTRIIRFYTPISTINSSDTTFLRSEFTKKSKLTINATSLYFSPILTLCENSKIGIYLGPNIEVIRQRFITNNNYSLVRSDTVNLRRPPRSTILPEEQTSFTYHNFSFGLKIPLFFQVKKVNINIVPSIGVSKRVSNISSNNEWYYGVYFNAIELDFGVNLGGEVNVFKARSKEDNTTMIRTPIIGIYLSKAFNLNPLGRYKTSFKTQ